EDDAAELLGREPREEPLQVALLDLGPPEEPLEGGDRGARGLLVVARSAASRHVGDREVVGEAVEGPLLVSLAPEPGSGPLRGIEDGPERRGLRVEADERLEGRRARRPPRRLGRRVVRDAVAERDRHGEERAEADLPAELGAGELAERPERGDDGRLDGLVEEREDARDDGGALDALARGRRARAERRLARVPQCGEEP